VTYMVDPDFSTGTMLSGIGDVGDIFPLADGGFFLGGTFNPEGGGDENSPFSQGLGSITSNGNLHPSWGSGGTSWALEIFDHQGGYLIPIGQVLTKHEYSGESWYLTQGETWGVYFYLGEFGSGWDNPYEVVSVWDIFIQEDQSVLIGGAIATDTLQPNLFRHLMRLLPDGSHDDSFPIIEAMPQHFTSYISKIEQASDGSWYVSGWFEGINGHYSPHVAHLTPDFEVDTDFVSPLKYAPNFNQTLPQMRLLDSQDRIWVSGVRVYLEENPSDTLSLLRLLPNGELDTTFEPRRVKSTYPLSWDNNPRPWVINVQENQSYPGHYFVAGLFNLYDDTLVNGITVVDNQGYVQENYFQGDGATENQYHLDNPDVYNLPGVLAIEQLPDGSLMLGGGFSEFMGVERYHLVKLNPGTLSTDDHQRLENALKVFPNPASQTISIQIITEVDQSENTTIEILDLSSRTVLSFPWRGDRGTYDISTLAKGAYLLQIVGEDGVFGVEKVVVN
ncbi:MAG: T9SS type A sorting domain-containing protein, partial [Flavobacteriales bacterium]|nr:T9SS type A sorting domain-containing protein [Flavobacteriales bacterium]